MRHIAQFEITLSFSKTPRFLHSYSSQESAETDKYIGDFAKLRVIKRVAYNFKTLEKFFFSFDSLTLYDGGSNYSLQSLES